MNQLKNRFSFSKSQVPVACRSHSGGTKFYKISSTSPKGWTKLANRLKLAVYDRRPLFVYYQAQDFSIDSGTLYYQVTSDTYTPQPSIASTVTVDIVHVAVKANTEKLSLVSFDSNQYCDSSFTEIDIDSSNGFNIIIFNEINGASPIQDANNESFEKKDVEVKASEGLRQCSPVIGEKDFLFQSNSESVPSLMKQASKELVIEVASLNSLASLKAYIHTIYDIYSTSSDELTSSLLSLINIVFDLTTQDGTQNETTLLNDIIAYWLEFNQGFSIEESVWRECVLENDEILFAIGVFLNQKAEKHEYSDIDSVLSLLSMISNHKITSSGYLISRALVLLSEIGDESITTIINEILGKVMVPINIPLDTTRKLKFVSFDPWVKAEEVYMRTIKSLLRDSAFDVTESAVKLVSYLSKTPVEYMIRRKDYFMRAIFHCLKHQTSTGSCTFRSSHWLSAALECPRIFHRFREYFSLKVQDCSFQVFESSVMKMFMSMRCHLIFSTEFNLIPEILALYKLQPVGTREHLIRILTQEEASFRLTIESISRGFKDPAFSINVCSKRAICGKEKKSVSWKPKLVACPISENTKKKTKIQTSEITASKELSSEYFLNEEIFEEPTLEDEALAAEALRKRVAEINAKEKAFIRRRNREKWARYSLKVLPLSFELAYKQRKLKENEALIEEECRLYMIRKNSFNIRAKLRRRAIRRTIMIIENNAAVCEATVSTRAIE
ncbi:hypothetical protein NADFUDRAFT_49142 [Nadsonia fulvescens var. elongata DSM 6958]|uniref:Uncharacterized protein n=1 Tax=Nadsonia fulvescens var. elongata DSM 6958 TaxID=857566 RepID=A0A1E3PSU9_9ASCO|nr:hypothetical protein NADFUDRAFT_49142 [Nadsonia fulvescens var. elongata DSM 6958]